MHSGHHLYVRSLTRCDAAQILATISGATGINESSQVCGDASGVSRGFVWSPKTGNQIIEVKTFSSASSISERGQVVGAMQTKDEPVRGFLWEQGKALICLSELSAGGSVWPKGINDKGQVVGEAEAMPDTAAPSGSTPARKKHAFLWESGRDMLDLGTLGGTESCAKAISESSVVVGNYRGKPDNKRRAFVWTRQSGMIDLNDQIDPSLGWLLETADSINDKGWIVGTGSLADKTRGFLLVLAVGWKDRPRAILCGFLMATTPRQALPGL